MGATGNLVLNSLAMYWLGKMHTIMNLSRLKSPSLPIIFFPAINDAPLICMKNHSVVTCWQNRWTCTMLTICMALAQHLHIFLQGALNRWQISPLPWSMYLLILNANYRFY